MSPAIEKALKHRVILIAGEEETLRRRALTDLLAAAEVDKDDFDLEVLDADGSVPMDWVASVGTAPFLAARRTTVVRHLLRCELDKLKGTDLSKLPETSLLILVADDEGGSEDRVQRMKTTVRKGWEKAVTSAGGSLLSCDVNAAKSKDELKLAVAGTGKSMSDKAIDALLEMTGGSLSRAVDELEKLVLFVGPAEQIRESDVRTIVVPSREWNVFKMVDAIVANEVPEALRQLRVLVSNNSKAEDAAFRQILPQVSRQLRMLWQGCLCVESKCSPSNAPASVLAMFPEKPNLSKEPPYRQNAVMNSARRLMLGRLERCFGILSDTDARLKGALPGFSAMETLERMILEMASVLAAPRR
jgi:DNA polymerase-3 subunit delta